MNAYLSYMLAVLIGSLAGLFGGALGQSGAEFMLPSLLILGVVTSFKEAAGTVLLAIVPPISILAVWQYYKRKQVNIPVGIIMFLCYFITAYVGAYITKYTTNSNLQFTTGVYYALISIFFFWNSYTGTYGEK